MTPHHEVPVSTEAWKGPGEGPHHYSPDYQAMGDCRYCGHIEADHHQPEVPVSTEAVTRRLMEALHSTCRMRTTQHGWDAHTEARGVLAADPTLAADLHDAPYLRAIEEAARAVMNYPRGDRDLYATNDLRTALAAYDAARAK